MKKTFQFREGNIEDEKQLRVLALVAYGEFEKVLTKENWGKFHKALDSEDSYEFDT